MKDDSAFIKHILDEIDFLTKTTKAVNFGTLLQDETLKRACLRSLEIIGEAAKNVSPEFKQRYPNVEWKEMAGLRDKLIHFYFGVDWEIVWDVLTKKIPALKNELSKIV